MRRSAPIHTHIRSASSTPCKIINPVTPGNLNSRVGSEILKKVGKIGEGCRVLTGNERLKDFSVPAVPPKGDIATPDKQQLFIVGNEMDALRMENTFRQSNGNDPVLLPDTHRAALKE